MYQRRAGPDLLSPNVPGPYFCLVGPSATELAIPGVIEILVIVMSHQDATEFE